MALQEFDDDDVLASGSEEDEFDDSDDLMAAANSSGDEYDSDMSDGGEEGEGSPEARGLAAAAPASGAGSFGAAPEAPDALLAGQMTSDAPLLQLEVSELLCDVRLDYSALGDVEAALGQLRRALAALPEAQVDASLAKPFLAACRLPSDFSLAFSPPTAVTLVGSFALRTLARPSAVVDVAVEVPRGCLHPKDHVNYRYLGKRALFVAHLAKALTKAGLYKQVEFGALQHDPRKPTLLLTPRSSSTAGLKLQLIPCLPRDAFPVFKLAPSRNNVRWVAKPPTAGAADANGTGAAPPSKPLDEAAANGWLPTPCYNACILSDMLVAQQAQRLAAATAACPRLVDGILLLKAWARQKGLSGGPDGFSGHLLTCLMAALAEKGKVFAAMSPLQMLRAGLHGLCDPAAGLARGLFMEVAPDSGLPRCTAPFKPHYAAVLVESSGWLNVAANVTKSAMAQARLLAQQSLALLDHPADPERAFTAAFVDPCGPAEAFDYHWIVALPSSSSAVSGAAAANGTAHSGNGAGASTSGAAAPAAMADDTALRFIESRVETLVKQALGSRATLVRLLRRRLDPAPSLAALFQQAASDGCVHVSARLDPTAALRLVDVGPPADDAKAADKFRALWGDKSELHRFQDGKISETVVWEAGPAERHTVPDMSVSYLLQRHLPGCSVSGCAGRLDGLLAEKGVEAGAALAAGRSLEAAVEKLSKQLRNLADLALKVIAVQPVGAACRHTSVFVPQPHPLAGGPAAAAGPLARCLEPVEVLVQLEGSGRWPDDPEAYRKMKAALSLQLAGALEASLGLASQASEDCLDVMAEGFAFRLLMYSEREAAMLQKAAALQQQAAAAAALQAPAAAGAKGQQQQQPPAPPPRPSAHAHEILNTLLVRSLHHGLVCGVEGGNPALGPATRLAKRWLAAHLLSNHICEEAAELLVLAAFGHRLAAPPPGSRLSGFLRFLHLLARHPWHLRPLVVDPTGSLREADVRRIQAAFDERRAAAHVPAMFLATPHDQHSAHWTAHNPSVEIMQRLVPLAEQAAQKLERLLFAGSSGKAAFSAAAAKWRAVFRTPLRDFDALVLLRKEALPQAGRGLPPDFPEVLAGRDAWSDTQADDPEPPPKKARAVLRSFPEELVAKKGAKRLALELLIGFEPVPLFVQQLEAQFGHLATFCADYYGGSIIGVKWRAAAFLPAPLRVSTAHTALELGLTAASGAGLSVPNLPQVLAEVAALGAGLVDDTALVELAD